MKKTTTITPKRAMTARDQPTQDIPSERNHKYRLKSQLSIEPCKRGLEKRTIQGTRDLSMRRPLDRKL